MTRRFIAIFTALLLTASLCACANNNSDEEDTTGTKINIQTNDSSNETTESESNEITTEETTESVEITTEAAEPAVGELTYVEQKDTVYVLHSSNQVNLRAADDTPVGVLENGTELQRIAISEDGAWSKILFDDGEYYIGTACVTTLKDVTEGFDEVSKTLYFTGTSVNVRIAPNADNEAVGMLYNGAEVKVIGENTELGWYMIDYESSYEGPVFVVATASLYSEEVSDAE